MSVLERPELREIEDVPDWVAPCSDGVLDRIPTIDGVESEGTFGDDDVPPEFYESNVA